MGGLFSPVVPLFSSEKPREWGLCRYQKRSAFSSNLFQRSAVLPDSLMYFIRNLLWCSSDLAEEITQQVFVAVLENLTKLKDPDSFRSWVFRIARFIAYKELRKDNKKMPPVRFEDWEGSEPVFEPWEYMDAEELQLQLAKHLNILTKDQLLVFVLHYYQHLSNSDKVINSDFRLMPHEVL